MAGLGLIMAGMQRIEFRVLLPMVIGTQVLTVLILQGGIDQPYRQPQSLRYNNSIQLIGPNNVELILSDTYAEYINHAIASAHNSGYKSGMPMIDLTGQSPGLLFALGAKSIGHPWTLGGYPGSELFLEAGLSRFSCEDIANAWLIIEPNGPRSISERVLFKVGVKYPEGYEFAGVWSTAQGVGGFDYQRMQELYKPIAPKKALRDCQMLR